MPCNDPSWLAEDNVHFIITGGSSGIGLAIGQMAVAEGHNVSIIARNSERLDSALKALQMVEGGSAHAVCADVKDELAIKAAITTSVERFGACDVLITSAGVVEPALFTETTSVQFHEQIETNFFGTINAVRAIYPAMKDRGHGCIMMISSGAALIGIPGYSAYCASKAALASFAESLRSEAGQDVHIGISFPPDTITPQLAAELPKRPEMAIKIMGAEKPWPVEKVAKYVLAGIRQQKKEVHFGWQLKALALLGPYIKPFLYRKIRS